MTTNEIIAQIIGAVIILTTILSPHFKTRLGILTLILTANILSCVMFFVIDARTGFFALIVTTIRSSIYWAYSFINHSDKKIPAYIFIIFTIAQAAAIVIGWVDWVSIFMLGLVFNSYGQWQTKDSVLKVCLLLSSICVGIYCLHTGAFTGAINKFLQSGSTSIALYCDWKTKQNNLK